MVVGGVRDTGAGGGLLGLHHQEEEEVSRHGEQELGQLEQGEVGSPLGGEVRPGEEAGAGQHAQHHPHPAPRTPCPP